MAQVESLRTHLVDELRDLLDAENQLIKALPKMAKSASTPRLNQAFQSHLTQTRNHAERLKQALRALGESSRSKTCEAMQGLLEEGETMMNESPEGPVRDAVMITAAQKVEHYEIATYGTVATYAQVLGVPRVARLLAQTLREEKAADQKLTTIAEGSVNRKAAEAWASAQEEESLLEQGRSWVGQAAQRAAQTLGIAADEGTRSGRRRSGGSSRRSRGGRTRRAVKRSRKK